MFNNLNIVIGISGGIAAYKACGIISYLKKEGANIYVIMTENATKFITPLTLEVLSGHKWQKHPYLYKNHRCRLKSQYCIQC